MTMCLSIEFGYTRRKAATMIIERLPHTSEYSKGTAGAEEPLVVVRQRKWVNEPEPGKFEPRSDERITEWQVIWLSGTKRTNDSIERFLREKGVRQ
jgi:hypothetical protein